MFIQEVHDWEVESIAQLLKDTYTIKFKCGQVDKLVWSPWKKQGLQLKSYYKALRGGEGKVFL